MSAVNFQQTTPILRIFDLEKARAFYIDFLGMKVDWEHRFEEVTDPFGNRISFNEYKR